MPHDDDSGVVGGGGSRRGSDSDGGFTGGGSDTDAGSGVTGDTGADTTFGGGGGGDDDDGGFGGGDDDSGVVGGGGSRAGDDSDTTFGGGGSDTDAGSGVTGDDGDDTTFGGGPSDQNRTQAPSGDTGTTDPQPDPERGTSVTETPTGETVTEDGNPAERGETTDRGVGVTRGPEGTEVVRPAERRRPSAEDQTAPARAEDVAALGPAQQRDPIQELSRGERRAVVNQFGRQQLEAERTSEQFGDIPIRNPATGNRLERDLQRAGEQVRRGIGTGVELTSQGAVPATTAPGRTVRGIAIAEQAGFRAAEARGFVDDTPSEGPLERGAEAATAGAVDAFNVPSAGAEAKEIAEFAVTQPQRIAATGATAATDASDDSPLPGLIGESVDAGDRAADTPFVQDVEQRAERVFSTAQERFAEQPIESTAGLAGGLAGGLAAGTGLGRVATRIPGISGSDLSGRALQGVGRAIQGGRRFASDRRAQGQVPRSRGTDSGTDDSITDLPDDIAGTEPVPESGRQRFADPSDALPDRGDDIGAASRVRQQRERAADEQADETTTGVLGDERPTAEAVLDDRDLEVRRRRRQAQQQSVDVDDPVLSRTEAVSAAAAGAGVVVPGLVGESDEVAAATQSGELVGADVFTDGDAAGGVDSTGRSRLRDDLGSRLDQRLDARGDQRFDTRLDSRLDTRQDTRFDTRQDTRQDVRADARFDTRADTRQDTRADLRFDQRTDQRVETPGGEFLDDDDDDPEGSAAAAAAEQFFNPVADPDDFLGGGGA